jgi:SAM-dependent methyltransferase
MQVSLILFYILFEIEALKRRGICFRYAWTYPIRT